MMNIKTKIRIVFVLLVFSLFAFIGQSFARYSSSVNGITDSDDNGIQLASFIVENTYTDSLDFNIDDFTPGDSKEFNFCISNFRTVKKKKKKSDVSIKYRININSYVLPLTYSLKKSNNSTVNLNCNRIDGISCQSSDITLSYSTNVSQCYILTVSFNDNSEDYINSIDIVTLTIDSWQLEV